MHLTAAHFYWLMPIHFSLVPLQPVHTLNRVTHPSHAALPIYSSHPHLHRSSMNLYCTAGSTDAYLLLVVGAYYLPGPALPNVRNNQTLVVGSRSTRLKEKSAPFH